MHPRRPRRVLVTRSPHQASELADRLRALSLEPVLIPAIELAEPSSYEALDRALTDLDSFDWLVFTSGNAVQAFKERVQRQQAGITAERTRIAAIGGSTARAIEAIGLRVDLIPTQAVAESLAEALVQYARQSNGAPTRFLLVRAEEGREVLPERLRAAGADVTIAPAYRTILPEGSIPVIREFFAPETQLDAITFTSSSSARNLVALCEAAGVALPPAAIRASIGPITSATLRELGYPPHVEAFTASVEALAEAVWSALTTGVAGREAH